mgnify:CR=1 FL=1
MKKLNNSRVMIKMIVDNFWNWIVVDPKTNNVTSALGGSYDYDGKNYVETSHFKFGEAENWELGRKWRVVAELKKGNFKLRSAAGRVKANTAARNLAEALRGAGQSGLLHSEVVELRKRLVLAFHLAGFGFHGAGALLLTLRGNSKRCGLWSLHVLVLAQEANREDAVDRR